MSGGRVLSLSGDEMEALCIGPWVRIEHDQIGVNVERSTVAVVHRCAQMTPRNSSVRFPYGSERTADRCHGV